MRSESSFVALVLAHIIGDVRQSLRLGIAADVVIVHEVCGRRYYDCRRRGTTDLYRRCDGIARHESALHDVLRCCGCLRAAFVKHLYERVAVKFVVHVLRLCLCRHERSLYHSVGCYPVDAEFLHIRLYRSGIAYVEVQFACLRSLEAHHRDVVFERREHGARVCNTVVNVCSRGGSRREVERAHIALHVARSLRLRRVLVVITLSREAYEYASCRLILRSVRAFGHPVGYGELLCGHIVLVEDILLHLRKHGLSLRVMTPVGRLSPEGILVKLQRIHSHASADHGAEATVAERQRLFPV